MAGLAGGMFGAYRTARGIEPTVADWGRLREATADRGAAIRPLDGHATLRLVTPDWRPLRLQLEIVRPDGSAPDSAVVKVEADGWPVGEVAAPPGRSTHALLIRQPPERREKLQLRLLHEHGGAVAIARLAVAPEIRVTGMLKGGAGGFLTGAALAALLFIVRLPPRRPADRGPAPVRRSRSVAVFAAVAAYLAIWAGVKPVLQAPDEPQHLMKANAVLRQPWLTAGAQFEHVPRFVNPLPLWTPPVLGRVFFNGTASLSAADLDQLKRVPWPSAEWQRHLVPYRVALASYPTLYYLASFALAQPLIDVSGASPYQAVYVYRMVTLLLASLAWTALYVELRRSADLQPRLATLFVFLLANPMLAFVSSAVSADALAIPFCIGGAAAGWRLLSTGDGRWRALAWLIAAALVKPAGLQMIVAVAVAALVTWYWWRGVHLATTLVTTGRALAVSYAAYYAWSSIHIYAAGPTRPGLLSYVATSAGFFGDLWISYWGKPGWLDYALPTIVYVLLLVPVGWVLREAWRRPELGRGAQCYFGVCFVAFAATTYAIEYLYLHEGGYFIHQGRYFAPASICLAPLLFHRGRWARLALVSSVLLLNAMLLAATVQRYYAGDWGVAWHALPWSPPR
jgi:hypothetical protein